MGNSEEDVFLIFAFDEHSYNLGYGLKRFLVDNEITNKVCIVSNREGDIISSVPDSKFNIFVTLVFLQLAAYKLSVKFNIDTKHVRYSDINDYIETKL